MSDGISFFNNDEVVKNLNIVLTQTNYTKEEAINKLQLYNGDYMKVIREFMGLPEKKETKIKVKSVNQEIFRQIRHKLDESMQEYRDKNPIDIQQVAENLAESEKRQKQITKN